MFVSIVIRPKRVPHCQPTATIVLAVFTDTCVEGRVVTARSPCYDPGELGDYTALDVYTASQRLPTEEQAAAFRAFYKPHSTGHCMFMSTKGEQSAMQKHQGGDFDGDDMLVIWDTRITEGFKPWSTVDYGPCSTPPARCFSSKTQTLSAKFLS